MPTLLDIALGMEKYYYNWNSVEISIPRPDGFIVEEEICNQLCSRWKPNDKNGRYAIFLLNKKKRDHFSVIREINSKFKLSFKFIGIKDANAITTQVVYIDLASSKSKNIPSFYSSEDGSFNLEFIGTVDRKLNHTGNHFSITLATKDDEEIENRLNEIARNPFLPNFVGYQRFGSRRPVSHVIGRYLLRREWEKAFIWILGMPFIHEYERNREIREGIMNGNGVTINEIPSSMFYEKALFKNFLNTNSFYEALRMTPLPIEIYVDAFQSYIFNKYLSRTFENIRDVNYEITLPTYFSGCDDICKEIYIEEGIDKGFLSEIFGVKVREIRRRAFMRVSNLSSYRNKEKGKITVNFSLPRGSYATIFLREISHFNPLLFT
ncbi:tRNA pseudouridine(13) synthase TruD [Sulfuracidifex metallicus]|nr:tRNA pseudouridine(13) synthase TruD [Sulfuracidifex metallicus]WOE50765.1 tRNA pseudouridine(13) synthase TruD [Sulfuracidifex metallicus DSM 6482 = JCM 9184]